MEESKTQQSAGLIALHFPRQRKTAKRLVTPRVQAQVHIGEWSFSIELSAPIEGLKLFDEVSLPLLGYLFHEIARKAVEQLARQPKPGRARARSTPEVSMYDVALESANLIGPLIWQWLTKANKKGVSNADQIIMDFRKRKDMTAKELLVDIIQANWEKENGKWPGRATPNFDPETFFRKLNKYGHLTTGYSLLPLPPAHKMIKNILGGKQTYNYKLLNGYCVPPKHLLPPLNHPSS